MINEKERKQIQRYCVYPKIALAAIIMSFVMCGLLVLLEMIDDLVFHNKGFQPAGLITIIGFVVVYVVIFCYCMLCPRFGMRGRQWRELQARLQVKQTEKDRSGQVAGTLAMQASSRLLKNSNNDTAKHIGGAMEVAGAVSAVATASDVLSETWMNAEEMANTYGVRIPKIKKWIVGLGVLPVLIVIGVYIPQYMQGRQDMKESIAVCTERIETVKEALAPVCEYVYADNPQESYSDYSYHVTGNLRERGDGVQASYVYITFDTNGTITEIHYTEEIDPNVSLEENLTRIRQDFEILHGPLADLDVPVADPDLLMVYELPDTFQQEFLSGSLYEEIRMHADGYPIQVYCSFSTETEEDFDEYSKPDVSLLLSGKN